jgi:hypothetical protein
MSSLVDDVQGFIARYVVMDDDQRLVVALWVLHTYVFEVFTQTPYLAVNSPEKQCGKTTLVGVLENSCNRPWNTVNPSEAVLYRKIHAQKPTLLLDEVQAIFKKGSPYEHLQTLLNVGNRAGTKVPRVLNPKSNELIEYNVFCPKVLAGTGVLPDMVADRSIPIRLERRTRAQTIDRFRPRYVGPIGVALRDQIEAWVKEADLNDEPPLPEELSDRQQDCAEPLLSIADSFGRGDEARLALVSLFTGERVDDEESLGVTLLKDLRRVFDAHSGSVSAYSESLVKELKELDESPWAKYDYGKGLDATSLAALLRPYSLHSKNIRGQDGKQRKGYRRHELEYVWERYLGDSAVTAVPDTTG